MGGGMTVRKLPAGDAIKSYRYLRIGIICAVLMLGAAVAIEVVRAPGCWQESISGYYYTPVRAIFVGALMAIGLALIVIKGPPLEDISLNIAGMFAPLVAIVPTTSVGKCWSIEPEARPTIGPEDNPELAGWVIANVENNFYALALTGLVGLAVACFLALRDRRSGRTIEEIDRNMRISAAIAGTILLVLLVMIVTFGTAFFTHVHLPAAGLMFAALNVAVIAKSREHKGSSRAYFRWYSALAWLMPVGGIAVWGIPAALGSDHDILFVEIWEIAMFTTFWVVQTVDNWHEEPAL